MKKPNVAFATVIWRETYERMLGKGGIIAQNLAALQYQFVEHICAINNGIPEDYVLHQEWPRVWMRYHDSATVALRVGDLVPGLDGPAFWYTIGPLVAIFRSRADYILFVSDDVTLTVDDPSWIDTAIEKMEDDPSIMACSPQWWKTVGEYLAEHPDNVQHGNWLKMRGFSDHCFLIRRSDFLKPIYDQYCAAGYPVHGAFEHRIGSYMQENDKFRLVALGARWHHEPRYKYD